MSGRSAVARGVRAAILLLAALLTSGPGAAGPQAPAELRETGLYADFERREVDPGLLAFSPQYPLWTDGAAKRRWAALPAGTVIDGSDPDAWVFPVGARFWKEFSFGGRPVETRYIERLPDGTWLYAAYAWSEDGRSAELVPPQGRRGAYPLANERSHAIPSVSDCKVCHEAAPTPILGFGALQLSPDRDPGALHRDPSGHGVDLVHLIEHGLLANYPEALFEPRIAAATPDERAALGYLHGNCGHCHDAGSKLRNIGLFLRFDAEAAVQPTMATAVGQAVRKPAPGQSPEALLRVAPGHPERSALAERIGSRRPALQMPPLGTELVDREAVELIRRWIAALEDNSPPQQE